MGAEGLADGAGDAAVDEGGAGVVVGDQDFAGGVGCAGVEFDLAGLGLIGGVGVEEGAEVCSEVFVGLGVELVVPLE